MVRVGEDISEKLDIVPVECCVHRHVYGKWAFRCCQRLEEAAEPQIIDSGNARVAGCAGSHSLQPAFGRPAFRCAAMGTPGTNVQVGIMDEAGQLLPLGEAGEIVYRSPQVLSGYLRDPEATDAVFRHGWFHLGDAGYLGPDGLLWFTDKELQLSSPLPPCSPEHAHPRTARLVCATGLGLRGARLARAALRAVHDGGGRAAAGTGIGPAPRILIAHELRTGELVIPVDLHLNVRQGYYFAYPEGRPASGTLEHFRKWLLGLKPA